jgi:hypothetical protein
MAGPESLLRSCRDARASFTLSSWPPPIRSRLRPAGGPLYAGQRAIGLGRLTRGKDVGYPGSSTADEHLADTANTRLTVKREPSYSHS